MNRFWLSVCAIVLLTWPVAAQPQVTYNGTDITGQLQLARTVNVTAAATTVSLSQFGAGRFGPRSTVEYKTPSGLLRPPSLRSLGAVPPTMLSPSIQALNVTEATGVFGFIGLTHYDQRNANNGNQFSVEPPNPSIAVGNGFVLQGVNNAIQIYSVSGSPSLPKVLSSNELFGLPPAIDQITGVNGPYPTDMRVFFDHSINRWFVLQRAQDYDVWGFPLNSSQLYLAVSQTADPLGNYSIYTMNTTDALSPGCPCLYDFPQIGADQYGFYISANKFNTFSEGFVNAAILAISKTSLAASAPLPVVQKFELPFTTGYEFAIQPATTPPGTSYFLANGGLEYFVSSNSRAGIADRLAVWAMYNTSSLGTGNPNLVLVQTTSATIPYRIPDIATQRPGPRPYGESLGAPLSFIDGADHRVLSLTYAGGRLFTTLASQVTDDTGRSVVGGTYVVFTPTFRGGLLAARVMQQGYLAARGNHLLRPAVAVNGRGDGAISFTLVGPDHFPSAAFVPVTRFSPSPDLRVAAPGVAPQDGFTGYELFSARWGDYSGAWTASDGSTWMVMQYIPGTPRTEYANWGTYVARYVP